MGRCVTSKQLLRFWWRSESRLQIQYVFRGIFAILVHEQWQCWIVQRPWRRFVLYVYVESVLVVCVIFCYCVIFLVTQNEENKKTWRLSENYCLKCNHWVFVITKVNWDGLHVLNVRMTLIWSNLCGNGGWWKETVEYLEDTKSWGLSRDDAQSRSNWRRRIIWATNQRKLSFLSQ